ncbi:MAG TPA: YdeI/OmpD-associated family protein [Bacteroidota bacterium]|nr:YdeI/OmpD-associated family protein [Bacteroidota bacterium]
MGKKDPRVDAYIGKSAGFAKPILEHLRSLVHDSCPNVEESVKWGFPHFTYNGILCSMASFKGHCAFGFWKGKLVVGSDGASREAMGHFGRITTLADLPPDKTIVRYIRTAMKLNEEGVPSPTRSKPKEKKPLKIPAYFKSALAKNKKALRTFDAFPYSHKKEYLEWVTEAKTEETRQTRLRTAVEWMAQGKARNWKYMKK